ncbi:unnamed protein product [Rotaria socialis]|uniref:mitogen-activated protein kinase kinase n=1 Tax=Rotaria socialis TaxID=392032 RepID=A0A818R334_9BILA|nr:unnamed protein product [Rotaria socialis]CAF3364059.1 unnamed protein product [Rotaria socialis]CAF3651000.1 unnamed protein product [Rotaria socialis]CAF4429300.1 unnamed protein product [Rotaria socialis]CAF4449635.1 unnamed protein product [Rotaria socialis]
MEHTKDELCSAEEDTPESINDANISVCVQDTKAIDGEKHCSEAACLSLVDTAQPATSSVNHVGHDYRQLSLLDDLPPLDDKQGEQPTESVQDHSSMVSAVNSSTPSVSKWPQRAKKNRVSPIFFNEIELQMSPRETRAEAPVASTEIDVYGKSITVSTKNLEPIKYLGSGCYGSVHSVKIKTHPDVEIAVKRAARTEDPEIVSVRLNELNMTRKIRVNACAHIIDYYGDMICNEDNELCIFMELMNTTIKKFYECFHQMEEISRDTIDRFLCHLLHAISSALDFLTKLGYLHGDVKPCNVLINNHAVIKLSDLGTCCEIDENGTAKAPVVSTAAYYSPELVDIPPKPRTIQADMWAMGITLVEVADGKHPCLGSTEYEQFSAIQLWEPEVPETIRLPPMRKLISSLLSREPKQRPQSYANIHDILDIRNLVNELSHDDLTFVKRVINMNSSYPTKS